MWTPAESRRTASLPQSTLKVYVGDNWIPWWRSDSAPARWLAPDPRIIGAVHWQRLQRGLELARLRLAGTGEAWRVGVVLVRMDPHYFTFSLTAGRESSNHDAPWTIADAPGSAALAVNAGQFTDRVPWGWVVRNRRERKPPGRGPLAPAVVIRYDGQIAIVPTESIAVVRRDTLVRFAFQSYPTLIERSGDVPLALRDSGLGVDVSHRDSRLAFAILRDGRVLVALTRFEALGGALSLLPFGLTAPETAALMGALGAQSAVMLDGGISGQLQVRDSLGKAESWSGLRRVPLALLATPKAG